MRIDKLIWFLRLAKSRAAAQVLVQQGHLRLNTRRVERCAQSVGLGDVLVLPIGEEAVGGVRVIEILALPNRRGPASEAQSHYRVLDERRPEPLAAHQSHSGIVFDLSKGDLQP